MIGVPPVRRGPGWSVDCGRRELEVGLSSLG